MHHGSLGSLAMWLSGDVASGGVDCGSAALGFCHGSAALRYTATGLWLSGGVASGSLALWLPRHATSRHTYPMTGSSHPTRHVP